MVLLMNSTANGIEVSVIGAILTLNGTPVSLTDPTNIEGAKTLARYFTSVGETVTLKRGVVRTYVEPASARDAKTFDAWSAYVGHEDDDGSRREMNPWTWNIVGKRTEDAARAAA